MKTAYEESIERWVADPAWPGGMKLPAKPEAAHGPRRAPWRTLAVLVVLGALAALALSGCAHGGSGGGGGPPPPASDDLAGFWTGTWSSSAGAGAGDVGLSLAQVGVQLTGNGTLSSTPCGPTFDVGVFGGQLAGTHVAGTLLTELSPMDLALELELQPNGDLVGTYAVTAGCSVGDVGQLALTKSAAAAAPPPELVPAVVGQVVRGEDYDLVVLRRVLVPR